MYKFLTIIAVSIIGLGSAPHSHAQYVFDESNKKTMQNLYYHVAIAKESEVETIAIRNLTQTLRAYGPKDSKYLTTERVERMVFDQNATDLAVFLAEMRRKAEYEITAPATQDASSLNVPEQGKVYQKLRELEQGLKQRASGENASSLAPDRTYKNSTEQSWHDLIESGTVLQLFTVQDINDASALVNNLYQLELDLATLHVELTTDQHFGTMFENGSVDDSFYDLVEDINVLDEIWYGVEADVFTAGWLTPKDPPAEFQDPRMQEDTTASTPPSTIRLGQGSGVFVPQTNQAITQLPEHMQSREQATQVSSFFDALAENRSFMPLFTELNTNIEIPGNHKKFCTDKSHFCIKVDINILSYPLLGTGNFSLIQQLREWKSELSDMSQKNLTIKTVGKNIFEIGLTPGADLGELLNMNIITSAKPINFPTEQKPVEERATDLMERIQRDLANCQNSQIAATNVISQGGSTILGPAAKIIATQTAASEQCANILTTQNTVEDQELRNELHTRTQSQFTVMTQTIKTILHELEEIHKQTITIEGKPRK